MSASFDCGVPATEASTTPALESGGIRLKSAGRRLLATYCHGPVQGRCAEPAPRDEHVEKLVDVSTNTSAVVFVARSSSVLLTGWKLGCPLKTRSSAVILADVDRGHAVGERGLRLGSAAVERIRFAVFGQFFGDIVDVNGVSVARLMAP